jgi:hypothetical protein
MRGEPGGTAFVKRVSDDNATFQIGAGCNDDRFGSVDATGLGDDAGNSAVFHDQIDCLLLFQKQIRSLFDGSLHFGVVFLFVSLRAQRIDAGPLPY